MTTTWRRAALAAAGAAVLAGCSSARAFPDTDLTEAEARARYVEAYDHLRAALTEQLGWQWRLEGTSEIFTSRPSEQCRMFLPTWTTRGDHLHRMDLGTVQDAVALALDGRGEWTLVDPYDLEAYRLLDADEAEGGRFTLTSNGGTELRASVALRSDQCDEAP